MVLGVHVMTPRGVHVMVLGVHVGCACDDT